jgi:hypothetical protein
VSELRLQQVALPLAAVASLVVLVGLFGDVAAAVCLAVVVLCAVITAPARNARGGGWWNLLALGALVSVAGALLALVANTVGGLIAVLGGVLVVVAAAIGFPTAE